MKLFLNKDVLLLVLLNLTFYLNNRLYSLNKSNESVDLKNKITHKNSTDLNHNINYQYVLNNKEFENKSDKLKKAAFSSVKIYGDKIFVTIDKLMLDSYVLLSIDSIGSDVLLAFAKKHFGYNMCDERIECYKYNLIKHIECVYKLFANKDLPEKLSVELSKNGKQIGLDIELTSDKYELNEKSFVNNINSSKKESYKMRSFANRIRRLPIVNNIANSVKHTIDEVGKLLGHTSSKSNNSGNSTTHYKNYPYYNLYPGHYQNINVDNLLGRNYHNNIGFLNHFNTTSKNVITKPYNSNYKAIPSHSAFLVNKSNNNKMFNSIDSHYMTLKEQEILNEVHKVERDMKDINSVEEKMIEKVDRKVNNLNSLLEREKKENQETNRKNFILASLIGGILVAFVFFSICGMFKFFFSKNINSLSSNLERYKQSI